MTADQLETDLGTVTVLHRLALAVECRDHLTDRDAFGPLRVGRQAHPRLLPRAYDAAWPCLDLETRRPGRFKLRDHPSVPRDLVLRIDDPTRHYVPRRFSVHVWPSDRIRESGGPYVPVASRLLRCWIWPGSAYPAPRGATVVRGRVERALKPARWARVIARTTSGLLAGRAHADDRGEFLLVVTATGQNPVESMVDLNLTVRAPQNPGTVDPHDRCADLVIEDVPRSSTPPAPGDLDNARLRGTGFPVGYVANTRPPRLVHVPVGGELVLTTPVTFVP